MAQPDLTTSDRVKDYLRVDLGDNGDAILLDLIATASRLIRRHTKRRFTSPRETETRELYYYGLGTPHIDEVFTPADVTSITDAAGMPILYSLDFGRESVYYGADLELQPLSSVSGIKGLPESHADNFIRNLSGDLAYDFPEKMLVTGTFGYAEGQLPPEVTFAATRAVAIWFKEEVAHYTEDAFISRGNQFLPDELPPVVISSLKGVPIEYEVAV